MFKGALTQIHLVHQLCAFPYGEDLLIFTHAFGHFPFGLLKCGLHGAEPEDH